jgi:hypothetical protein
MIQRRAARMVYADYQTTSSVSTMLNQLQWTTLACDVSYLALLGMELHEPVSFPLLLLFQIILELSGIFGGLNIPIQGTVVSE